MQIGSRISHYEILERLEEGWMGEAYKARDVRSDRLVAVELLSPPGGTSTEVLREARAAASLDHPNVCPVHEIGETAEGELFLVLGLCPGETLKARLERRALTLYEALDLAAQIAAGLAAAHERGIVHRDLRPANVRIAPVERIQVVGFALAPSGAPHSSYRSPEQLAGGAVDARTDVWSLGVVLYEMLTGKLPFPVPAGEVERAILQDAPVPLAQRLPGSPAALERILARALAKAPAARYAHAAEMQADLLTVEEGLPVQADGGPLELEAPGRPAALPPVLAGRRISNFQVGELLGGGGMGVLYRAEDVRLGRTVALKFLAPELGRDQVAKARFLTEARAASALEHPNLCTILDVGETEGLLFLAMPLYQGESLERRLSRGPIPVEEALDIATQAARGLAKAHHHGIVHRDIKPANLFLTDDGVVKVLDFGIAKLAGESGLTRAGSLLGTPFYMSPEQTRGEEVDARADVWSLGAVLYQMLAGRLPFAGGTGAAVVYAVLHHTPQPLADLRPEVSPELARIVSRMLARELEQRYPDAVEALAELRRLQGLVSTTLLPRPPVRRRRHVALATALALIAGAGMAGLLVWRRSGETAAPRATNFRRLTDLPGKETFPSLSPDGKLFAYAKSVNGKSDLFLQRVDGGKAIDLTASSTADDTQPAFSPDGQQIAFRSEREGGGVFLMGTTGESPRRLTDFGFNPAWSPDGRAIAVATESAFDPSSRESHSQIFRLDLATQARRALGVADGVQPSWSPHGWRIAYWGVAEPGLRRVIWTVPAEGGTPTPVIEDSSYNWSPAWSPDGKFLYFASNREGSMNLWRVAIDERSGKVLSEPKPITTPAEWSAMPSLSHDGRLLLYATKEDHSIVEQVAFDPQRSQTLGSPALLFQGARYVGACDSSPDSRWLVCRQGSPQEDLLLIRSDGSEQRQLTNDPARDRAPHWSPDGGRILFYSNRSGKYEAWTIRPDGSGLTQVTRLPAHSVYYPTWSPDGRSIAFTYDPLGTAILDLAAGPARMRLLPPAEGGQTLVRASWSRDGSSLVGELARRDGSPVPGIVLWSLADNSHQRLTETGSGAVFFHGGRQILFVEPGAVRLVDVASREVRALLSAPAHSSYVFANVGAGDRSLVTVRTTDEGDIWALSLGRPGAQP